MNLKLFILIFSIILIAFSCKKEEIVPDNNYSSELSFEISKHLFPGQSVTQIEFSQDGYFYAIGKTIFFLGRETSNSFSIESNSDIMSMAYNSEDRHLYFGTNSSGLGKLENENIQYFTMENSAFPRNLIRHVECDNSGNVWFNSSAHQLGGLIKYDGRNFNKLLPENSQLPANLIHQVKIKNGKTYVVSSNPGKGGTITSEINSGRWIGLFESGGCFMSGFDIDSNGKIYFISDSREYCGGGLMSDEVVFSFSNNEKTILREFEDYVHSPYLLKIDKRDYVWVGKFSSDQYENLSVFDGESWNEAPIDFPDDFINCIEVDNKNNIWLGTSNGIYVLNQ